jgi:phosphoribosylamine--glycine ligase
MPSGWERWPVTLAEAPSAFYQLAERAKQEGVDLAVIGPDNALAAGIADVFQEHGILTFGPKLNAAKIEASKAFGKEIMQAAGVPTARAWIAHSVEEAKKILKSVPWGYSKRIESYSMGSHAGTSGWVVKADGLALGKGVRVCEKLPEALNAAEELILISGSLVIEERLYGEELSWMAFCDGERCSLLEPARDYKRLLENDAGPNTGGMGAFSPVPGVPSSWSERVRKEVFIPTLQELKRRGSEFRGLLYAGLMIDPSRDRFWVLEFNSRFGDPEAQVLLPRMDGDLYDWCVASARGDLSAFPSQVPFKKDSAVYVVAASQGYPDGPHLGQGCEIKAGQGDFVFAGVRLEGERLVTAGGRVLGSLGLGPDLGSAREKAYQSLSQIEFHGMRYRSDIGSLG